MEYTKGEWLNHRPLIESKIINNAYKSIAIIVPTDKEEETQANAQLIAVAPELYEALKSILNTTICDYCYEDECGGESSCTKGKYNEPCNCHNQIHRAKEAAYKAIAKAEGNNGRH